MSLITVAAPSGLIEGCFGNEVDRVTVCQKMLNGTGGDNLILPSVCRGGGGDTEAEIRFLT